MLQPLPILDYAFKEVSIDFIEGLPKSSGKEVIFVVVNRLTKYTNFSNLSHPYVVSQLA